MTKEEVEKSEVGIKFDSEKPRYDLIPPKALEKLVSIYTHGASKYSDRNWEKGMSWHQMFGALMRHSWAFWAGEDFDKESHVEHMASAAFCCMALLEYMDTHKELDDRPYKVDETKIYNFSKMDNALNSIDYFLRGICSMYSIASIKIDDIMEAIRNLLKDSYAPLELSRYEFHKSVSKLIFDIEVSTPYREHVLERKIVIKYNEKGTDNERI